MAGTFFFLVIFNSYCKNRVNHNIFQNPKLSMNNQIYISKFESRGNKSVFVESFMKSIERYIFFHFQNYFVYLKKKKTVS